MKNSKVKLFLLQKNKKFFCSTLEIFHVKWVCLTLRSVDNILENLVEDL
jgi:hypothetical protein